jgi:methylmalonyl-CoA mutase N-terminal domain/subunit
MAYDEALEIPAEEAVLLSLRTQQIIAHETGVPSVIDPLGGSYLVENLTGRLEREAYVLMDKIDDLGGMVSAIGSGALQGWIAETAYNTQRAIHSGDKHVVGLNMLVRNDAGTSTERPRLFEADRALQERQTSRLAAVRAARDSEAVARALEALKVAAAGEANLMPLLIDAVEAKASVGEISDALREVFGEYKEPVVV